MGETLEKRGLGPAGRAGGPGTAGFRFVLRALVAGAALLGLPSTPAFAALPGRLGTNLGAVTYYDGVVPFADLVQQAGDWIPNQDGAPWGGGPALRLRRDGWPSRLSAGQVATAVLAEVRYPAGTYSVSWSGRGSFDVNGRAFASGSSPGGSGTVELDGQSIVILNLRSTDPSDPLREIRVVVPGESPTAVFRGAWLASLVPYGAVRFMDWQRTNSAAWEPRRTSFTCNKRVLPGSYSQGTSAGVSVERMVELANLLGVDPWFNVPHEAATSWLRCHAKIVAASLSPGLVARYEFSNETWNPGFRAFHDLSAEGDRLGLGGGDSYLGLQRRTGQRHVKAMRIVEKEFARAGRSVVRVLAGQAANAWVLEQRLLAPGAASATDEIAIAPYLGIPDANPFDPAEAGGLATLTVAQVLARMAIAQGSEVDAWTASHVALAADFGKVLVAYEGGQHLAGDSSNDALTALFVATNRSAGMASAYRTYLDRWREATGNALFMHFTDAGPYTQWGSWGALEYPEQSSSPKYDELVRFAAG